MTARLTEFPAEDREMIGSASRITVWGLSLIGAAAVGGLAWLSQTVEVPLVAILILTFVPTMDLIRVARSWLEKLEPQRTSEAGNKE